MIIFENSLRILTVITRISRFLFVVWRCSTDDQKAHFINYIKIEIVIAIYKILKLSIANTIQFMIISQNFHPVLMKTTHISRFFSQLSRGPTNEKKGHFINYIWLHFEFEIWKFLIVFFYFYAIIFNVFFCFIFIMFLCLWW